MRLLVNRPFEGTLGSYLTIRGRFATTAHGIGTAPSSSLLVEDMLFPPWRHKRDDFENSTIEADMSIKTRDRGGKLANGTATQHGRSWAVAGVVLPYARHSGLQIWVGAAGRAILQNSTFNAGMSMITKMGSRRPANEAGMYLKTHILSRYSTVCH